MGFTESLLVRFRGIFVAMVLVTLVTGMLSPRVARVMLGRRPPTREPPPEQTTMFRVPSTETDRTLRLVIVAVLALSVAALLVTIGVMIDFLAEQAIVHELIAELPAEVKGKAETLEGELRWQFRLSMLIVLNLVVTGFAIVLLSRAYRSSQKSLRDVKVLAGDILSSMDQAVITTDMDGNVTSVNRRGLELLGPTTDPVGRSLSELSHSIPLEAFRRDWSTQKMVATTRDFDTRVNSNDRVLRGFCQTLSDIEDKEIGYVLQLRDVTDRVLIEDRVRRMERYLGLGSLAVGLHHEIKNPLAALSLHVQLLEEQLEGDDTAGELQQMLSVVRTEVRRIGSVLEGFRDFASMDRLNLTSVNLHELIGQQVELIRPRATQQQVVVDVQFDEEPPVVRADRVRLEQVLLNLLVNALDAMSDGGRLTVSTELCQDCAKIRVVDTGSGIPTELQDKVFDAYFTTKASGTGLGLALCDKIMRQHDGGLTLQSTAAGTTFEMTLATSANDAQHE